MKKIFTLIFALGSFCFANAQSHVDTYGRSDNHYDAGRNDNWNHGSSHSISSRERDAQIARVNNMYDARIRDISFDRTLRENRKRREISQLNIERSKEINNIIARFSNNKSRFGDTYALGNNNGRH